MEGPKMTRVASSRSLIICSSLLLVLAIFAMCFNLNFSKSQSNSSFDTFATQVTNITRQYARDYQPAIQFQLSSEVTLVDNQYYVTAEQYSAKTGDTVQVYQDDLVVYHGDSSFSLSNDSRLSSNADDQDVFINLNKLADNLGYTITEQEDTVSISNDFQTCRLIVKSTQPVDTSNAVAVASGYNDWYILQYDTEQATRDAYERFCNSDTIQYVDIDMVVQCESTTDITEDSINNAALTAISGRTDHYTWGADHMGVDSYIDYLTETVGTDNLTDMVVAVLDTGIDTDHYFFEGRLVGTGANYSSSTNSSGYAYEDKHGHGTHVAGTICDITLDNVKILPVKVLDDAGYGYTSGIVLGIQYVIEQKESGLNVTVINLSLGGDANVYSADYQAYSEAISNAYDADIFSVVAAGNDGVDVATQTPANVEQAITVSAVGYTSNTYFRPTWSNYGQYVDICAPGYNILSAGVGGGLAYMSGTSMAAPHVSAGLALMLSDSTADYTMQQILDSINFYAIDLGSEGWDQYYGYGLMYIGSIFADMLESLTFSETESVFTEPFDLTISCSDPSATIYYTLDGTTPSDTNGTLYTGPIHITTSTTVKAIAYVIVDGTTQKCSQVKSMNYYYYGTDIETNFSVDAEGTLVEYLGDMTEVTIPTTVGGVTVVSVGERAFEGKSIEIVHLPESVVSICRYAYYGCSQLTTVYGPGVTEIDMYAFAGATSFQQLTDFYFPSLTTIGKYAFYGCYSLNSITLSNLQTIDDMAFSMGIGFYTANNLRSINLPNVTQIGIQAFYNCYYLSVVNLPNVITICSQAFVNCPIQQLSLPNVQNLGNGVFENNTVLTSVSMPNVTFVGAECFRYCTALTTLYADSLVQISKYAFDNCTSLAEINLPSVEAVGMYAFYGCTSLETVNLPSVETISYGAFANCSRLNTVTLDFVVEISADAFYDCMALESVTLSPTLVSLHPNSFASINPECQFSIYGDTVASDYMEEHNYTYIDLASSSSYFTYATVGDEIYITGYKSNMPDNVVIPSYIDNKPVTKIMANAFENCTQLEQVTMTELVEIEQNAFAGCTNLTTLNLPNLQIIGSNAFYGCTALNDVDIPNVTYISDYAFYGCKSLLEIHLGESIENIGAYSLGYEDIDKGIIPVFVIFGYTNTVAETYATNNQITFNAVFKDIAYYYYVFYDNNGVQEISISWVDKTLSGNIILPSSYDGYTISAISSQAFADCAFITGVQLPDTITSIGSEAFLNCTSLQTINLENVTEIGYGAFYNCSALQSVDISKIETLNSEVFYDCDELESVNAPMLSDILQSAFANCISLITVKCPELYQINSNAFANCFSLCDIDTSSLTRIERNAFANCSNLDILYLPSITTISQNAFAGSGIKTLVLGADILSIGTLPTENGMTIVGYVGTVAETYANGTGITFVPIQALAITTNLDASYEFYVGSNYSTIAVQHTGYNVQYDWYQSLDGTTTNATNLDIHTASLTINTATTGSTMYFVILTNWDGTTVTSSVTAVDVVEPPFTFTGGDLVTGTYGTAYNTQIILATGGSGNFEYQLVDGELPTGLSFVDNTLSGTPTQAGEYQFVIEATDTQTSESMQAVFNVNIQARSIAVLINDVTAIYGEAEEELGYTINGELYQSTDDLEITLTRVAGNTVGRYTITGTSSNSNYNVVFTSGYYIISPRPITVTLRDQHSYYGDPIVINQQGYTVSSEYSPAVLNGDDLSISITKEIGTDIGIYQLTAECYNANYDVKFVNANYSIYTGNMRYVVLGYNGAYDGEYHWADIRFYAEYNATITYGLVDGEYTYSEPQRFDYLRDYTGETTTIYFRITADNYNTIEGSVKIFISKAQLTLTIEDKSVQYGQSDVPLTFIVSTGEIYGTDDLNINLSRVEGTTVGNYAITGTWDNANYEVTFVNGTYTIEPAPLQITIDSKSSNYSEAMQTLTYSITNGDVIGEDDLGVQLSTTATNSSALGEYAITGTWNNENYDVTFVDGVYTITKSATALIDEDNGVLVELGDYYSNDMTLLVTPINVTDSVLQSAKDQGFDLRVVLNIQIMQNGVAVELPSACTVKLACTDDMTYMRGITVCDMTNTNAVTDYQANLVEGFLVFDSADFSSVAIVTPCTPRDKLDSIITWLIIFGVALVIIIVLVVYFVIRHKRQHQTIKDIKYRK